MLKIYKDNDRHKNDTKVSAPTPFFPVILPAGPQNQPWAVTERDLRKNGFKANMQILLSKQKW